MDIRPVKVEVDAEGKHIVVPKVDPQEEQAEEQVSQEENTSEEVETQENEENEESIDESAESDSNSEEGLREEEQPEISHDEKQDSRRNDEVLSIDDSSVLQYIKEKYEKDYTSLEEVLTEKSPEQNLPENIQKLLDFQKETNGTIEDFVRINKDWSSVGDEEIVREFLKAKKPHLNSSDIEFELESMFSVDEDLDSDTEKRAKEIAKKDFIYQARNHFSGLGDKFKASLESGISRELSEETQQIIDWKQEYDREMLKSQDLAQKQRDKFLEKTDKLFVEEFEGFEFKIADDKVQVFKPSDVKKLKERNLDVSNLLNKFVDKDGFISDIEGYHKAISIASNPDEFAKFFYEQGASDAITGQVNASKNPEDVRQVHQQDESGNDRPKYRSISHEGSQHGKMRLKHY